MFQLNFSFFIETRKNLFDSKLLDGGNIVRCVMIVGKNSIFLI